MQSVATPKIEIVDVPARPCVTLSAKVTMDKMPAFLQEAYGRLYSYAGQKTVPQECFSRYASWWDESCEVEAGVVTKDALPAEGEIAPSQLGGHRALHVLHKGPYSELTAPYEAIQQELKTKELKAAGAPYEIYYNDPRDVPAAELLTGVYWPIE